MFVITGPSGAGKGTLGRELLRRRPGEVELAVSATTRRRRPDEQHGRHYWFLSPEEFDRRVAEGGFLEWVEYVGNRYGTLRSELERIQEAGRAPLLDLEVEGAMHVRDEVPGSRTIFVDAPVEELERRLYARATESSGQIDDRIALARRQKEQAGEFDHVIENDDLERATEELLAVVDRALAAAATLSE